MPSTGGWIPRGHGERWEREWADGSVAHIAVVGHIFDFGRRSTEYVWGFHPPGAIMAFRSDIASSMAEAKRMAVAKHKRWARDRQRIERAKKQKLWGLF